MSITAKLFRSNVSIFSGDIKKKTQDKNKTVIETKCLTSKTNPYTLCEISKSLYVGMAPGKKDNYWQRDIYNDLQIISQKITIIVCLLEWEEMALLSILEYPKLAQRLGIRFYHLPIRDLSCPN